jgi:hypothetical protein
MIPPAHTHTHTHQTHTREPFVVVRASLHIFQSRLGEMGQGMSESVSQAFCALVWLTAPLLSVTHSQVSLKLCQVRDFAFCIPPTCSEPSTIVLFLQREPSNPTLFVAIIEFLVAQQARDIAQQERESARDAALQARESARDAALQARESARDAALQARESTFHTAQVARDSAMHQLLQSIADRLPPLTAPLRHTRPAGPPPSMDVLQRIGPSARPLAVAGAFVPSPCKNSP